MSSPLAFHTDWLDTLGASGMRVYAAPMFRSGGWYTPNGHEVRYTWDEQAGREGLDRAPRVIDRARHPRARRMGPTQRVTPLDINAHTAPSAGARRPFLTGAGLSPAGSRQL